MISERGRIVFLVAVVGLVLYGAFRNAILIERKKIMEIHRNHQTIHLKDI